MKYAITDTLRWLILPVLLWAGGGGLAQGQDSTTVAFTLEECIEYALQNNLSLKNARFDEYIAQKMVNEQLSAGLPQIDVSGNIQNNFELPVFVLPGPNGEFQQLTFGLPWQASAGISASQLLIDGVFFLGLKASRTYVELSEIQTDRSREQIAYEVSKAYYSVLALQVRLQQIDANLERVRKLYDETRAMYESGFVEKIDMERLEINYTNLELDRVNIVRLITTSKDMLKFQMGMPVDMPIELTEDVSILEETPPSLEEMLSFDISSRTEYEILETRRELQEYNMRRYRAGYFPNLYAFGNYNWNRQWEFNTENDFQYWVGNAGLQLNVPIFDGTRKRNQVQQVKLEIQKIDNEIENFQNATRMELRNAATNLLNAYNSLQSVERNKELAEAVYRVSEIKYKEGVGSSLEVNDAETQLQESEANYLRGFFDYIVAKLDMQKARGEFARYHE
jgi:outer membrane protein TolC